MNYEVIAQNIRQDLKMYLHAFSNLKSLVIGVSGGIDSAICCALARPVCDEMGVKLIGRSLPIETNKEDELNRARNIGEHFCHDFKEIPLGFNATWNAIIQNDDVVVDHEQTTEEFVKETLIRKGNLKARMRMIYLYDLAHKNKGMVLSTDNYTEYLLGFFTLHGDHNDYGMCQMMFKTEVYDLATYIANNECRGDSTDAIMDCVRAIPTDGLGISDGGDLDQIGVDSYDEVDKRLIMYINDNKEIVNCPVIERHRKTEFKRKWPIYTPRDIIIKSAT